jgi:hypothetical protein
MRQCPHQYFVAFTRLGFIFVDLLKSTIVKGQDMMAGEKPVQAVSVTFFRIKDADAATAANCYAKGICYLLIHKQMAFPDKLK